MVEFASMNDAWAIIKISGKQYKVSEGQSIVTDKIVGDKNNLVSFGNVLALKKDNQLLLGRPLVEKAKVTGKILRGFRSNKIRVVKFKSKSHYLRTQGHRQLKIEVLIEKIQI